MDFLIGNSDNFIKDKALLKRINEILALSDKDREHVFALLDAFLRYNKAKKVYSWWTMDGCWIDTYYAKRDEPYSKYKDSFHIYLYNDFAQSGPNTWKAHYGAYSITIVQQHRQHDISEDDVVIEKNPSHKENPDILYALPSKKEIANALNKYLDRIYG